MSAIHDVLTLSVRGDGKPHKGATTIDLAVPLKAPRYDGVLSRTENLLHAHMRDDALKLLKRLRFELWNATNHLGDSFLSINADLDADAFRKFNKELLADRSRFEALADSIREACITAAPPYPPAPEIRFVTVSLDRAAAIAAAPRVFISYSWEGDEHQQWVKKLATRLRTKDQINVILDQWELAYGDQLPQFMEQSVTDADFVLIICTSAYKERSDGRHGGVGYEGHIINAQRLRGRERKFIPVLRGEGPTQDVLPTALDGKNYADLRASNKEFEQAYAKLVSELHGTREFAPPLGRR